MSQSQTITSDYLTSDTKRHVLSLDKNFIIQSIKIHSYILLNQLLFQKKDYNKIIQHIFTYLPAIKITLLLLLTNFKKYKKQPISQQIHSITSDNYVSHMKQDDLLFIIKHLITEWR